MSLWNLFARRSRDTPVAEPLERDGAGTIHLRREPYVFECRACHKVFEVRRLRSACPECESTDVELVA